MTVLQNSKHEHFAQAVAKGLSASKAYISAGYPEKDAASSAARLSTNAQIRVRIAELQAELSGGVIALDISSRKARVQALQIRWDLLRQLLNDRANHYLAGGDDGYDKATPGVTTGLLCKTWAGDRPVYKIDTATLSALLALEKQAAEELASGARSALLRNRRRPSRSRLWNRRTKWRSARRPHCSHGNGKPNRRRKPIEWAVPDSPRCSTACLSHHVFLWAGRGGLPLGRRRRNPRHTLKQATIEEGQRTGEVRSEGAEWH